MDAVIGRVDIEPPGLNGNAYTTAGIFRIKSRLQLPRRHLENRAQHTRTVGSGRVEANYIARKVGCLDGRRITGKRIMGTEPDGTELKSKG